jgi:flagellin
MKEVAVDCLLNIGQTNFTVEKLVALAANQKSMNTAMQQLATGNRINSAKDDAAGLAVAEGLSSLVRGNSVALRNANDGISLGQTADGALGQIANNLQRIREIAVQSANGSISDTQRGYLQKEVTQLTDEITRVIAGTEFNGTKLLDGTSSTINIQVGSGSASTDSIGVGLANLSALNSNISGTIDVTSTSNATTALGQIDSDLNTVIGSRADFGAVQNRFDAVIANLQTYNENLTSARGRIVDADFAAETASLTRGQILQQASTAILAQANALPQNALTLLK